MSALDFISAFGLGKPAIIAGLFLIVCAVNLAIRDNRAWPWFLIAGATMIGACQ